MKKMIYSRQENNELKDVHSYFNNFGAINRIKNSDIQKIKSENKSEEEEIEKTKDFDYFKFIQQSKYEKEPQINTNLISNKELSSNLKEGRIRSFKYMKSMLGHISVIEDNIIQPVPIYCLGFSKDGNLIFTGDNNG
jgi:hypothetical protein